MLDVSIRVGILNLMLDLKHEHGLSFLYVTHDLASARYVADTVLVMYAGQIVEQGPAERVLQNPLHPYTRLLLASVPDPSATDRAPIEMRKGLASAAVDPNSAPERQTSERYAPMSRRIAFHRNSSLGSNTIQLVLCSIDFSTMMKSLRMFR